ncbi:MAG: Gfo/Idh/MocA family oxidoreductase [Spirochaetaceae bacterium]|nr:Gfo/Idh/MocA family oxidoreductase [Spirochaetaceae bacterium]
MKNSINVGLVGYGFMGRTHSNAYAQACKFFPHTIHPVLKAVCGRDPVKLQTFADNWGWESTETDWRKLIERSDIELIDICSPNDTHMDIVLAAAKAGKMIICEKPLAKNASEARLMVDAVKKAGVPNMVCFNYRRVPAVTLAKRMIDEGRLGRIFHYRAKYLQDWTMSSNLPIGGPTLWRLDAKAAGSGVTGDLLAHSIDLALWLAGPIQELTAMSKTFITNRPLQADPSKSAKVEIDDACAFLARFKNGALGTFESTRYARGRKNQNTFEINGELGTIAFDFENMNVLEYYDHRADSAYRGFSKIQVWDGDKHPYMGNWWVPGCGIGYEHTFIHAISDFLYGLEQNTKLCPDLEDGYKTQLVCDAVLASAASGSWQQL